jgi:hypothetical protein
VSSVRTWHGVRGKKLVVDLHDLRLGAVMHLASWSLGTDANSLTIITGRGLHSPEGKPVIKPELERYLTRNGYWWHYPEKSAESTPWSYGTATSVNPGAIVVSRI